jgi:hypothetical protein
LVEPSAHGGHVFAVPAQLFGALTLPPPLFVQFPVQFRFVPVLYPQPEPVIQMVPISPQLRVPHFLIEALGVQELTHELFETNDPQVFVVAHDWLETSLVVHDPPQALRYVP